MQPQVEATTRVTMSLWGMFEHSDIFMKILMIGLLLASVWSWAIIIDKVRALRRIRERSAAF